VSEDHSGRIGAIHRELHRHLPSAPELRVKALESLLVEKGLLDPNTVDAWIEVYTEQIGPKRGAEVVARAWTDPAFRNRLLADGTAGITEIGFEGWAGGHLRVVPNTAAVHNLVVRYLVLPERPAGTEDWDVARLAGLVTRNSMIGAERDLGRLVGRG
jgi:nitrile hydratase